MALPMPVESPASRVSRKAAVTVDIGGWVFIERKGTMKRRKAQSSKLGILPEEEWGGLVLLPDVPSRNRLSVEHFQTVFDCGTVLSS